MNTAHASSPIRTVPFWTRGTILLALVALAGAWFAARRFTEGISAITNLDQQHPWGLWIAIDVATGVALAAGGFTTSALAHVFHRDRYLAVVRPALLTALLGYTFVGVGLMFDLGRYYNIWHPIFYWQPNSVLFEVGLCVVCYLTVLWIEFLPVILERFRDRVPLPGALSVLEAPLLRLLALSGRVLDKVLFLFILLGVLLSCMHQSSLGALMLIAPTKVHALWWTPILPLLFLMSAICVGFPMTIVESLVSSRSFRLKPEMDVLSPLARVVPVLLAVYLAMKTVDMAVRQSWVYLLDGSIQSLSFLGEVGIGIVLPLILLVRERVRREPRLLLAASLLVVLGVAWNRLNVFLVSYDPPFAARPYFPSLGEFVVTAALTATIVLVYRAVVMNFPVIPGTPDPAAPALRPVPVLARPVPPIHPGLRAGITLLLAGSAALAAMVLLSCVPAEGLGPQQTPGPPAEPPHVCAPCPPCEDADAAPGRSKDAILPASLPAPDSTLLYHLADLYDPVEFAHAAHAGITGDCLSCHHYGSEVEATPPCRECHTAPMKDLRRPGLKGAYHRQCMGCHREMQAGPLDCTGCHEKRSIPRSEVLQRALAALPEPVVLGHLRRDYEPVRFSHALHVEMTDHCSDCHHMSNDVDRTPPCRSCHVTRETPQGSRVPGLMDAYHGQCMKCHGDAVPGDCGNCHAPAGAQVSLREPA